ncbi:hypothetical protein [Nesterenkonia flava]|uniref:Uncharacterized protein n=1 Tax=Nesterenkonia flava TaxID=469799 RepID=A0ABU1FVT5_9MICC|nr:hypothetical protein [Nesterenkonia flava]MDR5712442.1 hypothetical protein [Nesterenkonia flava]
MALLAVPLPLLDSTTRDAVTVLAQAGALTLALLLAATELYGATRAPVRAAGAIPDTGFPCT